MTRNSGRIIVGLVLGLAIGLGHLFIGPLATPVVFALLAVWVGARLGRVGLGGYFVAVGVIWTLLYLPGLASAAPVAQEPSAAAVPRPQR